MRTRGVLLGDLGSSCGQSVIAAVAWAIVTAMLLTQDTTTSDRSHWRGLRQLLSDNPDQIQMLHVAPLDALFQARRRAPPDAGRSAALGP
jgi:hypothetical protein